ncbi:hypothetical protein Daus18300_003912 [Diaporthe australafricana]|uniref:Uncharacterized protein n=1 Tax=Diaporthe australafricana TaxID=127596 RepID=A0ABR3XC93_9PEZI
MSRKRAADPFIKPDPGAKRVKREGDGNFSLSSIPMAPPPAFASSTSSAIVPKFESGDRKPLGPTANFGETSGNNRKRKFFGKTIRAVRDDDWVSCHFNKSAMVVEFVMHCALSKKWSSMDVEQELFQRLNKAKFDIQPSEDWGFLDRKFFATFKEANVQPCSAPLRFSCKVNVQRLSVKKDENSPL